jgi:hypothetical protein
MVTGKKARPSAASVGRVTVRSVNVPGYSRTVDTIRYEAMRKALTKALPTQAPGLTQKEMFAAVVRHLPSDLFPGGAKANWWAKTVQLDQEARGAIVREAVRPLRWHRRPSK